MAVNVDERNSYKKPWWYCTFILQLIYLLTSAVSLFCRNTHLPVPNLRGLVRLHSILVLLVCQIVARTISTCLSFLTMLFFLSSLEARIFFLSSSRLPVSGMLYTVRTVCIVLACACTEIRNTKREAWKVL
jgi:hypothetical protein